jgi:hypothetical protein
MAKGTLFGGLHSSRDLGLIQQSVDVQPAKPKLNIIDVPGADGSKDLSAQPGGRVVFADREITWTFALYPGAKWHQKHREVSNAINGLAAYITLDDDPGYYYVGRLSVDSYNIDGLLRQIIVRAICRPYKLKQDLTEVIATVTTTPKTITLANDRKPVAPTITVTAETTLEWDGNTYTIAAGTHKILDIQLHEGDNQLRAKTTSGTGTITLAYQEGAL